MLGLLALLPGAVCETQEVTNFGEPSRVTTSGQAAVTSVTSGGGSCNDNVCGGISWSKTIFPFLDTTVGKPEFPPGGCTAGSNCHNAPVSNGKLTLVKGDASKSYQALMAYTLKSFGGTPYVDPCHPENSAILCNLQWDTTVEAELKKYFPGGPCGSPMPKLNANPKVVNSKLSKTEFNAIVSWIKCGALDR